MAVCFLSSPAGNPAEFIVNTTNAGPGALAVTIDGPSKVKMDCQECPEGYKVIYTPMAPGSYLISIKFGGPYHIAGSPFKAKITGEHLLTCYRSREMIHSEQEWGKCCHSDISDV